MKHDPQTDEHQTLEDLLPNSDDIARALDRDAADETLRHFLEHAAHNPRLAEAVADFNEVRDAAPPSPQPAPQRPAQGPPPLPAATRQGPPPLPPPSATPDETLPSMGSLHRDPNQHTTQAFGTPGKLTSSGKGDTLRMLHAGGTSPEAIALAAHTPTHTPATHVPNYSATPFRAPAPGSAPASAPALAPATNPTPAPPARHAQARPGHQRARKPYDPDPPPPKFTMPGDNPKLDAALANLRALQDEADREQELRRKKLLDHKNARSAEIAAREAAAATAKALATATASNGAASGSATEAAPAPQASASPSRSPSPSSSGKDPAKEQASPWKENGLAAIPIDKAALPSAHAPTATHAPGTSPTHASQPASARKPTAATKKYPQRRVVALVLVSVVLPVLVWLLLSQLMNTEQEVPRGTAAGNPSSRGEGVEESEAPPVAGTLGIPAATAEPPITPAPAPSSTEASAPPTSPTVSRPNISAPPPPSSPPSKASSPPNAPAPSPAPTAPERTPEPPPEDPPKSAPQPDPTQPPDAPPPFYPVAPF